jgi:hypothetical protein
MTVLRFVLRVGSPKQSLVHCLQVHKATGRILPGSLTSIHSPAACSACASLVDMVDLLVIGTPKPAGQPVTRRLLMKWDLVSDTATISAAGKGRTAAKVQTDGVHVCTAETGQLCTEPGLPADSRRARGANTL